MPKGVVSVRLSPETIEILDGAGAKRGETIERMVQGSQIMQETLEEIWRLCELAGISREDMMSMHPAELVRRIAKVE